MRKLKGQALMLRKSAIHHKAVGNDLLAEWCIASAEYYEKIERDTERFLDNRNSRNREERTVGVRSSRERFAHQWFKYEEEYEANFSMD